MSSERFGFVAAAALFGLVLGAPSAQAGPPESAPTERADAAAVPPPAEDPEDDAELEPEPDRAAKRQRAAEAFFDGQRSYELGRYDEAIEKFELAWELSDEPTMLFNIAQAYWRRGRINEEPADLRKARQMFDNYDRRMRGVEGYQPRETEGFIAALDAQLEAMLEKQRLAREGGRPSGPDPEQLRLERRRKTNRGMQAAGTTMIVLGAVSGVAMIASLLGRGATGFMLDQSSGGGPGTTNTNTIEDDRDLRRAFSATGKAAFATIITTAVILPIGITLRVGGDIREREDGKAWQRLQRRKVAVAPGAGLLRVQF